MKAEDLFKRPASEVADEINRGGRFVVYQFVVSLVFVTFRRNAPLQFIRAGESATTQGLPWTLLTLVAGWWGIPFGFIYTPMVLAKNLRGGTDVTGNVLAKLRPAAPSPVANIQFDKAI
ncbi:hypothetical protein SAMN05421819_4063 [Bryocella elongata]|uniref:Uncharacterized protein n=1 Tax=Bryocella elongata TaxID=863522 RepID=A0A1H6BYK7_9BACT|nr:hypothetical protein [Bryocella elongata]SEG65742.1 hypothetical protein SAMN05421819_4063 [Bryocella elongata]